jgi:hypothetical protein
MLSSNMQETEHCYAWHSTASTGGTGKDGCECDGRDQDKKDAKGRDPQHNPDRTRPVLLL